MHLQLIIYSIVVHSIPVLTARGDEIGLKFWESEIQTLNTRMINCYHSQIWIHEYPIQHCATFIYTYKFPLCLRALMESQPNFFLFYSFTAKRRVTQSKWETHQETNASQKFDWIEGVTEHMSIWYASPEDTSMRSYVPNKFIVDKPSKNFWQGAYILIIYNDICSNTWSWNINMTTFNMFVTGFTWLGGKLRLVLYTRCGT